MIPALAVARELRTRGHETVFVGTESGLEARLVPAEGFTIEWIGIGGLKRVGFAQTVRTLGQLPVSVKRVIELMRRYRPAAVFSMGGYVAGPVMLAALLRRIPIILMEPNAMPGLTNRRMARFVRRALLSFPEAAEYFPPGRSEVTGLPVRSEFFSLMDPSPSIDRPVEVTLLITGGSRGSRKLNEAAEQSWQLFRDAGVSIRILHQTGQDGFEAIRQRFLKSGVAGDVVPFITDMPAAFAQANLVVCRSGAGAVAELAAAGKPSILVPFPFAADQHQLRNAEALERGGAARLVLDRDLTGQRLFDEIVALVSQSGQLEKMGQAARKFAHPHAAERAADLLEELAGHASTRSQ